MRFHPEQGLIAVADRRRIGRLNGKPVIRGYDHAIGGGDKLLDKAEILFRRSDGIPSSVKPKQAYGLRPGLARAANQQPKPGMARHGDGLLLATEAFWPYKPSRGGHKPLQTNEGCFAFEMKYPPEDTARKANAWMNHAGGNAVVFHS